MDRETYRNVPQPGRLKREPQILLLLKYSMVGHPWKLPEKEARMQQCFPKNGIHNWTEFLQFLPLYIRRPEDMGLILQTGTSHTLLGCHVERISNGTIFL